VNMSKVTKTTTVKGAEAKAKTKAKAAPKAAPKHASKATLTPAKVLTPAPQLTPAHASTHMPAALRPNTNSLWFWLFAILVALSVVYLVASFFYVQHQKTLRQGFNTLSVPDGLKFASVSCNKYVPFASKPNGCDYVYDVKNASREKIYSELWENLSSAGFTVSKTPMQKTFANGSTTMSYQPIMATKKNPQVNIIANIETDSATTYTPFTRVKISVQ